MFADNRWHRLGSRHLYVERIQPIPESPVDLGCFCRRFLNLPKVNPAVALHGSRTPRVEFGTAFAPSLRAGRTLLPVDGMLLGLASPGQVPASIAAENKISNWGWR